jgi:hypothetical protein
MKNPAVVFPVSIMAAFATLWWCLGLAQSGHGSWTAIAVGFAASAALVVLAARQPALPAPGGDANRRRINRLVGIASGAEGVAILVAINVLAALGRQDLINPAIAIVVGLHFLPLARWLPAPGYYLTALLMCALGMAACLVTDLAGRQLLTGAGMAALLWLTCAYVLVWAGTRLKPLAA